MKTPTLHGLVCLLTFVFAGCGGGSSDTPDTGPVSGTITVNGQPGSGLMVTYRPESGRPSSGKTDDTGHYELQYKVDVMGAKVGKGYISIATPENTSEGYSEEGEATDSGEGYSESEDPIPAKYNAEAADNPEMQVEIKAEDNVFDFDISTE